MNPLRLITALLLALCCATAQAQIKIGSYVDCLWDGSQQIRNDDLPKLLDAGFNFFATQITPDGLDTTKLDGKFLEACKAAKAEVLVERNTLTLQQFQQLAQKYPGVVTGLVIADDAHTLKPSDVTKLLTDAAAFMPSGVQPYITVAKGAKHSDYAALGPNLRYGVQNYLGKSLDGGGLKVVAYDNMQAARAVAKGALYTMPFLGKSSIPYFGRNDPVWRAQEYVQPSFNESLIWLGLIAECDGALYYTAYSIDFNNPKNYSRIGERWDLLPAYKSIHARIQSYAPFLQGTGVVKGRSVVGTSVIGTWTKPSGEVLTVSVDCGVELYPRVEWKVTQPTTPASATFKVSSDGKSIAVEKLP